MTLGSVLNRLAQMFTAQTYSQLATEPFIGGQENLDMMPAFYGIGSGPGGSGGSGGSSGSSGNSGGSGGSGSVAAAAAAAAVTAAAAAAAAAVVVSNYYNRIQY